MRGRRNPLMHTPIKVAIGGTLLALTGCAPTGPVVVGDYAHLLDDTCTDTTYDSNGVSVAGMPEWNECADAIAAHLVSVWRSDDRQLVDGRGDVVLYDDASDMLRYCSSGIVSPSTFDLGGC